MSFFRGFQTYLVYEMNSESYNLISYLRNWEKKADDYVVGKERFIKIAKIIRKLGINPESILDVGGNVISAKYLEKLFPNGKVVMQNLSKDTIHSANSFNIVSLESDFSENGNIIDEYDFIFCGETLHCIYNPDNFLAACIKALKLEGYLLISDLNLSSIYESIFSLLGWAPYCYTPSLYFLVGNPLFKTGNRSTPVLNEHKSTFTFKGLKELLEDIYKLNIIESGGYSYHDLEKKYPRPQDEKKNINKLQFSGIRYIINYLLPESRKEGMYFLCQKTQLIDLIDMILNKSVKQLQR